MARKLSDGGHDVACGGMAGGDTHRQKLNIQNTDTKIERDIATAGATEHHDAAIHAHGIDQFVGGGITDCHQTDIHAFTIGQARYLLGD